MWVQKVPGGGVEAITYSLDGRTLYVLDRGRTLSVWNLTTRASCRIRSRTAFGYSTALHPLAEERLVGIGREIFVWDTVRGEIAFGHVPEWPNDSAHVAPDGRIYFLTDSRKIAGIDLSTDKPLPPRTVPANKPPIRRFAFAPDEKLVAVCFNEKETVVYQCGRDLKLKKLVELGHAWDVQFSPSGRVLALANRTSTDGSNHNPTTTFWDTATWEPCVQNVSCWLSARTFVMNPVLPIFAAVITDGLTLYSLETGLPLRALDFAIGKYVQCAAFSPDGLTCAVGGSNKQFVVFDVDI